mgnify:CR=1 FL=1
MNDALDILSKLKEFEQYTDEIKKAIYDIEGKVDFGNLKQLEEMRNSQSSDGNPHKIIDKGNKTGHDKTLAIIFGSLIVSAVIYIGVK